MGILGLTHDENGSALEKLPVTIKVAIGEGPEPGNQNDHPRRLDHFVFKRKTLRGQDVVWDAAPDIAQVHGEKPTELGVIFLNDQPTEVLRTQYGSGAQRGCRGHGELVQTWNGDGLGFEMQAKAQAIAVRDQYEFPVTLAPSLCPERVLSSEDLRRLI